jgi:hypothetical protein
MATLILIGCNGWYKTSENKEEMHKIIVVPFTQQNFNYESNHNNKEHRFFLIKEWRQSQHNQSYIDSLACANCKNKNIKFVSFYMETDVTNDSILRMNPRSIDRYSAQNDKISYYTCWDSCNTYKVISIPQNYSSAHLECCK